MQPGLWAQRELVAWLEGAPAWWRAGQACCQVNGPQPGQDTGALQGVSEATPWKTTEILVLGCWAVFSPLWWSCGGTLPGETAMGRHRREVASLSTWEAG